MSEKEKTAFEPMSEKANRLTDAGYESAVLAITASYLAGKEAGKREAEQSEEGQASQSPELTSGEIADEMEVNE